MNALHVRIRVAGDDDTTVTEPKACKGEDGLVRELKIVGLLTFPFVETVGRDDASVGTEQVFEHGALSQGFASCIYYKAAAVRIFESPCGGSSLSGAILADQANRLGRGNVIAPAKEGRQFYVPQFFKYFIPCSGLGKSTAHGNRLNRQ